jgi:hypothetical protein
MRRRGKGNNVMEPHNWMKFKAVNFLGVWITDHMFYLNTFPKRQWFFRTVFQNSWCECAIDIKTLCRFVTHIEGVGDLYEGDRLEIIQAKLGSLYTQTDLVTIVFDDKAFQWKAIGDGFTFGRGVPIYEVVEIAQRPLTKLRIIGNIHDPKAE